jgi:hypothetical protein
VDNRHRANYIRRYWELFRAFDGRIRNRQTPQKEAADDSTGQATGNQRSAQTKPGRELMKLDRELDQAANHLRQGSNDRAQRETPSKIIRLMEVRRTPGQENRHSPQQPASDQRREPICFNHPTQQHQRMRLGEEWYTFYPQKYPKNDMPKNEIGQPKNKRPEFRKAHVKWQPFLV